MVLRRNSQISQLRKAMKICIVSSDKRYIKVNELLLQKGYDSFICSYENAIDCDCLLLSVRNELNEDQLTQLFKRINKKNLVLCGNSKKIKNYFGGRIIDYGQAEDFLLENARLTAEATLPYLYELTGESVMNKKVFVAGYGRIGRFLSQMLKSMGAIVSSYARRDEVKALMAREEITFAELDDAYKNDIVINTAPAKIFSQEVTENIPKSSYIVDLASAPYGFEDMTRVHIASALPGKYLQNSASAIVFDTIEKILSENRMEEI